MNAQAVALLALLPLLAGCVSDDSKDVSGKDPGPINIVPPGPRLGTDLVPEFSLPVIVDSLRAGGEPVIAVTPKGTILIGAHPGYTHWHPSPTAVPPTSAELVVPTTVQSYMWRSTDAGASWNLVTLLPVENPPNGGPRGVGQGVSDPDFAVAEGGRIYFTDLEALASASVSWSDDDGETWLMGNNFASGGFVDRQWLAAHGDTVYFRGNGANDVRKSDDGGLTWENVGDAGCGGDIVANPLNGHLYVGCNNGMSVSTDGGQNWDVRAVSAAGSGPIETEPAIDAAGTVYRGLDPARTDIVVWHTKDEGESWGNYSLKPFFPELANGTLLWPWTSAGSAGRVAVTFYASPSPRAFADTQAEWFVYTAIVLDADTASPVVYPAKLTPEPFHVGGMCQGGTGCQATTAINPNSDRRLGDFFETAIDYEGSLHVVYSDTQDKSTDTISHVGYVRLNAGPLLVDGELPKGFPTQG